MNTERIENILRKAPRPAVPAGLLPELNAAVELPARTRVERDVVTASGWFRRWFPALGFAAWFLGCLIVLGVQANRIAVLKEQARANQSAVDETSMAETAQLNSAAALELERLRTDLANVERLRTEVTRLRAELAELSKLQEENNRLRAELKAQGRVTVIKPEEDFFAVAQDRMSRVACINHIKQFCLGARIYANESKTDAMPRDTASFIQHLKGVEKVLFCPDGAAYEIVSPRASESRPEVVFMRCTVHRNVGMVDGSAQQLSPSNKLVQRDGVTVIER